MRPGLASLHTKAKESKSICWRPKLEDIEAMTGWKMAEVSRLRLLLACLIRTSQDTYYEVPAQKASAKVPLRECAISCSMSMNWLILDGR